jgi:phosphate transport system protein
MKRDSLLAREIDQLKGRLLLLGSEVEDTYARSIRSIVNRDSDLAVDIINMDHKIDMMEVDLEEECLKILALHQPVARDLRFIITVLKVNNDLERIGDLAVNVAEAAVALARRPIFDLPFDFAAMSKKTERMLTNSLNALVNRDTDLAQAVLQADDEVDAINKAAQEQAIKDIEGPDADLKCLMDALRVSRSLERIADLSTNIAEDVIYLVTGCIARHYSQERDADA